MTIKRHKSQVERDRREIARMYLSGTTQADIADKLKLNQSTVSRDLKIIQEQWQAERINDIDERKKIELARVDNLEVEYWQAWKRSQEDAETETIKMRGSDPKRPGTMEKVKQAKGQAGDPRFLQGVQWCISKRCDLLGLDAPKGVDLTSDGEKINAGLAPEEIAQKVAALIAVAEQRKNGNG